MTEVLTNYDGGKTMVGFGKITGTIYASWVIKMWGSTGTTVTDGCGAASKISGYVTMVVGLASDLTLASNCSLASLAKEQWAWTNLAAAGLSIANAAENTWSVVYTSAAEEYVYGAGTSSPNAVGEDPYIMVAGGATLDTW